METKLHQWLLLVNSYGFYVKNRNWFYSYRFHIYVTFRLFFAIYVKKIRIRENFHIYVIFYVTYITWRWKSRVNYTVSRMFYWYYSKTGCNGMGMCCKEKTMIGWRNVWNMRWRAPNQEVDQRGHGERLCKTIAKHVIWTGRMLWIVVVCYWTSW